MMHARAILSVVFLCFAAPAWSCAPMPKDPAFQRRAEEAALQAKIEGLRSMERAAIAERQRLLDSGNQVAADRIDQDQVRLVADRAKTEQQLTELRKKPLPEHQLQAAPAEPQRAQRSDAEKSGDKVALCGR
jgi:hypothetical protein